MAPQPTLPPDITGFIKRFDSLNLQRDSEQKLIRDLLVYSEAIERIGRQQVESLKKELMEVHLDLDDAKRSRRDMQQQLLAAGDCHASLEALKNRNPYIQVLIDGDGMIFSSNLIRMGLEGGKQAAAQLRDTVLELCQGPTGEIEIVANIYANQLGLANALLKDGSVEELDQLRAFSVGFTQGKASFNFIDVGRGKERADSKIKELTRWHLKNHNCKQILLGISHDAGYAPFLDEVVKAEDRSRVSIIEGPPVVRELSATKLQVINLNKIFRASKLNERPVTTTTAPTASVWASALPTRSSPAPFSDAVKNGVPKSAPKPTPKPAWEPQPRGLDAKIDVNAAVLDKIKRRTHKLCNNHYLRGPCVKGSDCSFEHNYKITEEEKKAIVLVTRLNPCTMGQDCDQEFCIYGHHCPSFTFDSTQKNPTCAQFNCRFPEKDHPPGTRILHPRKERWEKSEVPYY